VPKVLNKKAVGFAPETERVYVGRPSKWGNPYSVKTYGRANALRLYRIWLHERGPINDIEELRGKDLVCWCAPKPCHADYLLELANS
jgi:Domain of unknown function (DUF4326)